MAEGVEDLVRAADVLLAVACLDGVHVLHIEIARELSGLDTQLPSAYASPAEARRVQRRIIAEVQGRRGEPRGALAAPVRLWRRKPAWTLRAVLLVVLLGLTLRYAIAVSDDANWPRQHPEGNWISRFYPNAQFQGFPLVRYDVGINADFAGGAPAKAMKKDDFSARWDTCLLVARDVQLNLELEADDQATLFIDGSSSLTVGPAPGKASATLSLQPGVHHLNVEFVERLGMALVRLHGLALEDTDAYQFRRPLFGTRAVDGTLEDRLRCEPGLHPGR